MNYLSNSKKRCRKGSSVGDFISQTLCTALGDYPKLT